MNSRLVIEICSIQQSQLSGEPACSDIVICCGAFTNMDSLCSSVDLIEETGQFKITDSSFDFDLCLLDATIINKLESLFKQ